MNKSVGLALAELGAGHARRTSLYGTQIFRVCIHFHRKAPASEVHAPPQMGPRPLREILHPPRSWYAGPDPGFSVGGA